MQFQVPQFIETEDKMFGGMLTLRQFIYVAAGFGLSALLYFMVQTWLWFILSILILGLAGSLAFIKIEGRPFLDITLAAVGFYWKPQTYVWQPEKPAMTAGEEGREEKGEGQGGFSLENMLANMALRKKWTHEEVAAAAPKQWTREAAQAGTALHKKWEVMQTGEKAKPERIIERKMDSRYMIFERKTGERQAARRVDYR